MNKSLNSREQATFRGRYCSRLLLQKMKFWRRAAALPPMAPDCLPHWPQVTTRSRKISESCWDWVVKSRLCQPPSCFIVKSQNQIQVTPMSETYYMSACGETHWTATWYRAQHWHVWGTGVVPYGEVKLLCVSDVSVCWWYSGRCLLAW